MGPGHGAVIDNPQKVVDWTISHRLKREQKVLNALDNQPKSIRALVINVYDDTPKELHPIAELSLHAHLIKLEKEALAACDNELWSRAVC